MKVPIGGFRKSLGHGVAHLEARPTQSRTTGPNVEAVHFPVEVITANSTDYTRLESIPPILNPTRSTLHPNPKPGTLDCHPSS